MGISLRLRYTIKTAEGVAHAEWVLPLAMPSSRWVSETLVGVDKQWEKAGCVTNSQDNIDNEMASTSRPLISPRHIRIQKWASGASRRCRCIESSLNYMNYI